ncbi:MAG: redoxin domain-containing protein [Gemmatimonadales bacterium]|nr:redoxin domain-containing protein [Candidatus Palauibacter irciniicola]MYC17333.1 redoxin domain-containing protein [Gemmatimonadales bacterium]
MRIMDARHARLWAAGIALAAGAAGCSAGGDTADADTSAAAGADEAAAQEAAQVALGPVDGHDLPPADLERVLAGHPAPDFTALSSTGEPITLSDYRGEKDVILFFYRGHW